MASFCAQQWDSRLVFKVFASQMDLLLNLPYLCCPFVSVKHIIWTQQWDYLISVTLSTTITALLRKRPISISEMPESSCFAEKSLFSSSTFHKSLCWQLVFWAYIFCLQQWFLLSPVRWSWGLPKPEVRVSLFFCWWIRHFWLQVKWDFGLWSSVVSQAKKPQLSISGKYL